MVCGGAFPEMVIQEHYKVAVFYCSSTYFPTTIIASPRLCLKRAEMFSFSKFLVLLALAVVCVNTQDTPNGTPDSTPSDTPDETPDDTQDTSSGDSQDCLTTCSIQASPQSQCTGADV